MHNNWEEKLGFVDCIWDKGDSNKCQLETPRKTAICAKKNIIIEKKKKKNIIIEFGLALHLTMLSNS